MSAAKIRCAIYTRIGPISASAIAATFASGVQFQSGRDLSARLGLTPINKSTGGKERLGRISKMGDRYIRRLMVVGMTYPESNRSKAPKRGLILGPS